jgi:segregation and condensation protein A
MGYEVTTPVFEGPFDLLLHLILSDQVDIHEVSLARIVDAFLTEIERMEFLDLEIATEFLLIAATLVELKARRLLPEVAESDLDEELLRFEARDLLLARLLECKTFKDAAEELGDLMARASMTVARVVGPEEPYRSLVPDPLSRVTHAQLAAAAKRALSPKVAPVVDTYHVAPVRASVADAIVIVLDRLPTAARVSFRTLVRGAADRVEAVVRFLAVLELYKQGLVEIDQAETFGDLQVTRLAEARGLDAASISDWDYDVDAGAPAIGADTGPEGEPRAGGDGDPARPRNLGVAPDDDFSDLGDDAEFLAEFEAKFERTSDDDTPTNAEEPV